MKSAILAAAVVFATSAAAKSFVPRTDLEIVAFDAKTGAEMWSFKGPPLANAHFELYPGVLVAYPHYNQADKSAPIVLDAKTGKPTRKTRRQLVASSSAQWIKTPAVLANGWRAERFRPGYTKEVELVDPKTRKVAWRIDPAHYPEYVRAYKDVLLIAYGYLTDEAVVFAYKTGAAKPAWTIDFNQLLGKPSKKKDPQRLGRVVLHVIGDVLYAQTGEHVFAIAPRTGKILWRLDAAAALKIRYQPDLYGGALDVAVFSRDGDTLVVAFEKRVLAVHAQTGRLVWSIEPDSFPHTAFPLVKNGLVYLVAGPKRGKAIVAPRTAAAPGVWSIDSGRVSHAGPQSQGTASR